MDKLKNILKPCPVDFDEASHSYTLAKNLKLVPGVTSLTDLLNKPFLMPWAAKECAEAVKKSRAALLATKNATDFNTIVDECKGAYRRKSKDALQSGTIAHDWIENYIKSGIQFGNAEARVDEIEDKLAVESIKAFLEWDNAHKGEWLASELVVGSEVHEYGGKLDAIRIVDGIPSLIDFKTSSQISKDYFLQTAGYQIALEEMGLNVWQRIILRIPKDGAGFEALVVPTPFDLDRESFLALRQLQRFMSYVGNESNAVVDQKGKVKVSEKQTIKTK